MSVNAIPDPTTGAPTCPTGYAYDFVSGMCLPVSPPIKVTVTGQDPSQNFTVTDVTSSQVDPKKAGALQGLGWMDDGFIERLWAAFIHATLLLAKPVINLFVSGADALMSTLVEALTSVQGEKTPGFWLLCAALLGDLFGIEVDGNKMAADFNSKGRLTGVRDLGAQIVNLLASEFMDVAQTPGGVGFTVGPGSGIGGLPAKQLSPLQGVKAAQAFLGFATEFAVREGNVEAIAAEIPWGLGEAARTMAVNFARGVNLGRMSRIALKPIFQDLIATPLTWAINQQYRPKLFSAQEAIQAWINGDILDTDRDQELQYTGYTDAKSAALAKIHSKVLSDGQLRVLIASGALTSNDWEVYMRRHGYLPTDADLVAQSHDAAPARRAALAYAEYIAEQILKGKLNPAQFDSLVLGLPFITAGEFAGFHQLLGATIRTATQTHIRQLSTGLVQKAYVEGLITLQEVGTHLTALGFQPDDVQLLTLEALEAQAKAAGVTGTKAKAAKLLSVAIAQKAYVEGVITLPEFQAHVLALGYSAADMQVLSAEAVIAEQAKAAKATTTTGTTTAPPTTTPGP